MKKSFLKNIPNLLTFSRIIASIVGMIAFINSNIYLAVFFYIYGAISDFFDGFAARKLNAFSEFGGKLDAISDKLYAGCLLIPSIFCGNLLMLIPLLLELSIAIINLEAQKLNFKPKTQQIGRIKTVMLFPVMILGVLTTKLNYLYPILTSLLTISSFLQVKSLISYNNELKHNKNKIDNLEIRTNYDFISNNSINNIEVKNKITSYKYSYDNNIINEKIEGDYHNYILTKTKK